MQSFTIQESLSFAWSVFKKHIKFLVPLAVVLGALDMLISYGSQYGRNDAGLIISAIGVLLQVYLSIGVINIALRICRNESVGLKDLFLPFDIFWKNLLAAVIVTVVISIGFMLLVVPGFMWWTMFLLYSYFIVDKGVDPMESLRMSKEATKGERWHIFGFVLTILGLNIAGLVVFGVGLLVTAPLSVLAMAHVYGKLSVKIGERKNDDTELSSGNEEKNDGSAYEITVEEEIIVSEDSERS